MAEIIFVTGGSRSGKSRFALEFSENKTSSRLFLATCPTVDEELSDRVNLHKEERKGRGWETVEEEVDIHKIIEENNNYDLILIDCLTLWVNNLLFKNESNDSFSVEDLLDRCEQLFKVAERYSGTLVFVTNEVGLGIVPESKLVRLYRDLVGSCNQAVAAKADSAYLVSCGIPLKLK